MQSFLSQLHAKNQLENAVFGSRLTPAAFATTIFHLSQISVALNAQHISYSEQPKFVLYGDLVLFGFRIAHTVLNEIM